MAATTLRKRLKAWWEGYDEQEYSVWLAQSARSRNRSGRLARKRSVLYREAAWKPERIEIANLVWGEGYCGPDGPQVTTDLGKRLGLAPEMNVLMIGGGLGGQARIFAKEFGCAVDICEQFRELVEKGTETAAVAGLSEKITLEHYDFGRCPMLERKFDAVISTEALFAIENKPGALKIVQSSMKPCKPFVITDYVLDDAVEADDPDIQEWIANEPGEIFPIQSRQMISLLEQSQFNLQSKEDISEPFRSQIAKSWAAASNLVQGLLDKGDEGRPLIDMLLREATLWSRRSGLIARQKIRVMRYFAERVWFD